MFGGAKVVMRVCHIICDANIIYDNGAVVKTSFVTSYDDGIIARTGVELTQEIGRVSAELRAGTVKQPPKYEYPQHVLTSSMLQNLVRYGVDFQVRSGECTNVRTLDSQRAHGKGIYGGGLLLSDAKAAEMQQAKKAAAGKAAEEKADVYTWQLSDREKNIIAGLG